MLVSLGLQGAGFLGLFGAFGLAVSCVLARPPLPAVPGQGSYSLLPAALRSLRAPAGPHGSGGVRSCPGLVKLAAPG